MNSNLYGKYSNASSGKKPRQSKSTLDLNDNEYRQRPRSRLVEISREAPKPTLEEKIKAKENSQVSESYEKLSPMNKSVNTDKQSSRVQVEIWGRNYYLGSREGLSEDKIRRVAEFADSLLTKTSENNPGLIDSRVAILALLDCSEKYIELEDKYNNMRTDYMYYRQKEEEKFKGNPIEDTPMQDFFETKEEEKKDRKDSHTSRGKNKDEQN